MSFTRDELNLLRQWYQQVQDVSPEYLEAADAELFARIKEALK